MPVRAKIYLAIEGTDYEGFDVLGVFNKPEKAKKALDERKAGYDDYIEIQVFAMNGGRLYDDPDEFFQRTRPR